MLLFQAGRHCSFLTLGVLVPVHVLAGCRRREVCIVTLAAVQPVVARAGLLRVEVEEGVGLAGTARFL